MSVNVRNAWTADISFSRPTSEPMVTVRLVPVNDARRGFRVSCAERSRVAVELPQPGYDRWYVFGSSRSTNVKGVQDHWIMSTRFNELVIESRPKRLMSGMGGSRHLADVDIRN